jgi:hypothetical protein
VDRVADPVHVDDRRSAGAPHEGAAESSNHRRPPCSGQRDTRIESVAHDVRDRDRARVRRITRQRVADAEKARHHATHLGLVGATVSRDRELHHVSGSTRPRGRALARSEERDAARLSELERGLGGAVAEDRFDGDGVGAACARWRPAARGRSRARRIGDWIGGRGADRPRLVERVAARRAAHDGVAGDGRAGIDAEDDHGARRGEGGGVNGRAV